MVCITVRFDLALFETSIFQSLFSFCFFSFVKIAGDLAVPARPRFSVSRRSQNPVVTLSVCCVIASSSRLPSMDGQKTTSCCTSLRMHALGDVGFVRCFLFIVEWNLPPLVGPHACVCIPFWTGHFRVDHFPSRFSRHPGLLLLFPDLFFSWAPRYVLSVCSSRFVCESA